MKSKSRKEIQSIDRLAMHDFESVQPYNSDIRFNLTLLQ